MKQKSGKIFLWVGLLALLNLTALAQPSPVTPEQRKEANELYQAKNWEKAAESYQKISQTEPQNPNALMRLGNCYYQLKKYQDASIAFEKSEKISSNPVVTYNLAAVYSILDQKEKSVFWLEKSISGGFNNINLFQNDPDLNNLRNYPEYKTLSAKLDQAVNPCQYNDAARQFDFWVGEWEVKTQQGQNAGTNAIQKLENGCLLLENWTGSLGGTGKSINFYDNSIKKWRQIWVDSSGNSTLYTGEFKDGSMRYETESVDNDGKKQLLRLTFTPLEKNKVRQYGESSDDSGKTWKTTFDYVYILKQTAQK